eukprot:TRINITY_DN5369_c0_g1_i4.p1 TRINITY_DN5369_c0_g1~~TRINITY_DN5369_c0_g1_i4.p1  ORF type:complete len:588 (-),score=204.03 TRINITY_DN5369_c0_g1_i4:1836-3599(-)
MRLSSASSELPRSYSLEMLPSELVSSPRSPSSDAEDVNMEESPTHTPRERVNKHAIDFLIDASRAISQESSSDSTHLAMDIASPFDSSTEKFSPRGSAAHSAGRSMVKSASGGSKPSNFNPLAPSFSSSINKQSKRISAAKATRKSRQSLPVSSEASDLRNSNNSNKRESFNIISLPLSTSPVSNSVQQQQQFSFPPAVQQQQVSFPSAQHQHPSFTSLIQQQQFSYPSQQQNHSSSCGVIPDSPSSRASLKSVPKSMTFPFPQQIGVSVHPSLQYPNGVSSLYPYIQHGMERSSSIPQSPFDHIKHFEQLDRMKKERERSNNLYEVPSFVHQYSNQENSNPFRHEQQNQSTNQENSQNNQQINNFPFQFSPSKLNTPGDSTQNFTPKSTNGDVPRIESNIVLDLMPPSKPLSTEEKVSHYMSQIRAQTYCTILPIADTLKKEDKKIMCPFGGGCSKKIKGKGNLRRHMEWHLRKIEDDLRRSFGEKEGSSQLSGSANPSTNPPPSSDAQNKKSSSNWTEPRKKKGSFFSALFYLMEQTKMNPSFYEVPSSLKSSSYSGRHSREEDLSMDSQSHSIGWILLSPQNFF